MAAQSPSSYIVLVVEDEPVIRMIAVEFVEDAGFHVVEAADATEAVEILEQRSDIRLVFTDIDMPRGIDGMKLAALIRDRWPPIHILITSGHVRPTPEALPARSLFIPKPYRQATLESALRSFIV